jgi:hypothetical protein
MTAYMRQLSERIKPSTFNVKDNFKYQRKCGHLKILQAPIVP